MEPLVGYAPDLASNTPGILTNCAALVPSLKGMRGAPTPKNTTLPALSKAARGAALVRKLDNSTRLLVGTEDAIYESASTSWTDRKNGSGYTLSSDSTWRFAQFGDLTLAAAKTQILQSSTSGAFADTDSNAPAAGIVEVVNGFVFLADVNDQGSVFDSADRPHGWWAARDPEVWTPSVANEAYTGSLTSTPGKCTAARRFGQTIIVYKERSMYRGIYVGTAGWEFELIPGEAGAFSQEVVIDIGTPENPIHLFMGADDFYRFDGARPVPIGSPLRETVFSELNSAYSHGCKALHDRANSRVYFYYPVANSINPDKCVVYNYRTSRWGRDDRSIEAVVEYIAAGMTYDDLGTHYVTYDDLPSVSYDLAFFSGGNPTPAIINTAHVLQTLDGAAQTSTMETGDYGSDEFVSFLSRVQPLFLTKPASAMMVNKYRDNLGDPLTADTAVAMDSKGRFDVSNGGRSANWHRAEFAFTGDVEMQALNAELMEDSPE